MMLGSRIRWPEEEIGRNSVIPCTTAIAIICSIVMAPPPRLFRARPGSIRGLGLARFNLLRDGDASALPTLPVLPVDPACAQRKRGGGRIGRGTALGMAPRVHRVESGRDAAGSYCRRARADRGRLRRLGVSGRYRRRARRPPVPTLPRR